MQEKICVVGLGYVGLPLALALAEHYDVRGVDSDAARIAELNDRHDRTGEATAQELQAAARLSLHNAMQDAADCSCYIVTAPTPVSADYRPDLTLLEQATADVAAVLSRGDAVVFESTVCPGTTDDVCAPLLQKISTLRMNEDFDVAYSPERIAPKVKGLRDAVKIVAASNDAALQRVAAIYEKIVPLGLHLAPSIKTAEAAKLTENIQRDVDIAVANELAMMFNQMGIDSDAVLAAAATKWNFRRFKPGFVGGHCIGTDSYYLLARAEQDGMSADLLRAARRVNNAVPRFVADAVVRLLRERGKTPADCTVLLFGFSFKENCPDVRHTLVEDLRQFLLADGCRVRVCDPIADAEKAEQEYGVRLETDVAAALADAADIAVFAVAHDCFAAIPASALAALPVLDVKGVAARADWRL